jgi:hypothetical protein
MPVFVAEETPSPITPLRNGHAFTDSILGQTNIGSETILVGLRSDRCQGVFHRISAPLCAVFLVWVTFWLLISDWLMRRRMRKRAEYQFKLRQMYGRRYETSGSRWHRRN